MPFFGFVLQSGCVNSDTSGLFLRGFIDFAVFDVAGCLLIGQVLGDSGGEGRLSVIDVANGSDWK